MQLLGMYQGPWRIVTPLLQRADGEMYAPLLIELDSLMSSYGKSIAGFYELFKRIERPGPIALGTKLFHSVDKNSRIYEFIKGDLRLLCFIAPSGAICVCSTVVIKKGSKADKSAIAKTVELALEFQAAERKNGIAYYVTDPSGELVKESK